jgi:glutamate 5-kinase
MASKLSAARLAADAGVPVLLAAASDADAALGAGLVGTAFAARPIRLSARRFWVRHAADSKGSIRLDAGAVAAVAKRRRSLLAAGITAVHGHYYAGDVVDILGPEGAMVARGIVAYDSSELETMIGHSTNDLPPDMQRPVVHADDLVPA